MAYGTISVDAPSTRAKLVSRSELTPGNPFGADSAPRIANHDTFWVVTLERTARTRGVYAWELVAVDADTGAVVTGADGLTAAPAYFDALPDHGSVCPASTTASTRASRARRARRSRPTPG